MKIISFLRDKVSLHPFLIILYFIIHYLIQYGEAKFTWYQPILYFLGLSSGVILLDYVVRIFVLDKFNARYIVSVILVVFLFFQEIIGIAVNILPFTFRRRYVLIFCFLFITTLFFHLRKSRRRTQPNLFLNLLLIIYFLLDFFSILGIKPFQTQEAIAIIPKSSIPIAQRPDIYLLLLDGYTNSKSLEKFYHFDDEPFIDSLQKKGFYLASNSKSNYPFTILTLSSALNLNYHNPSQGNIQEQLLSQISSNIFTKTLQKNQYLVENYSIFNFENAKSPYDLKAWFYKQNLLFFYYSKSIFINLLQRDEKGEGLSRELNVFRSLDSTAVYSDKDIPKFVYAHILLPHVPFYLNNKGVFDKEVDERNPGLAGLAHLVDDDPNNNTFGSIEKNRLMANDYVNHIKFTNKKCLPSINNILKNQKRPTIIILMSDHGSRMLTEEFSQKEAINERYTNFCAIYYSDKNYSKLYDSITPINVMRQVLNKSIGTKYPNLKDLSGLFIK